MGQNSSSVPAQKLFVSDFLESPQNYCPSEPLLIPLRKRLQYDGLSVYRGSNFQPFTAHADTQLTKLLQMLSKLIFLCRSWKRFFISFTLAMVLDKKNYLNFIFKISKIMFLRRSVVTAAARRHDHHVLSIGNLFNWTLYNLFVKLLFLAGTKLKIKINFFNHLVKKRRCFPIKQQNFRMAIIFFFEQLCDE